MFHNCTYTCAKIHAQYTGLYKDTLSLKEVKTHPFFFVLVFSSNWRIERIREKDEKKNISENRCDEKKIKTKVRLGGFFLVSTKCAVIRTIMLTVYVQENTIFDTMSYCDYYSKVNSVCLSI